LIARLLFSKHSTSGEALADLQLALPWLQADEHDLGGGLLLRRGPRNALTYEDGITLDVRVLEPRRFESVDDLLNEAIRDPKPGQVTLVAGSIPLEWRAHLRAAQVSFTDISGVTEINWPRLRIRASRFGQPVTRHREPLPLQKGHARVAQVILINALAGRQTTVGEIAKAAEVSYSTASRTIDQLASFGLVSKERRGKGVLVDVPDPVELATLLAERTAWTAGPLLHAYTWGRSVWDQASRLSERAETQGVKLAVSGRVGAAFLGVVGTSSPTTLRCWVSGQGPLAEIAGQLEAEPSDPEEANLEVALDTWGVGLHWADYGRFDRWRARIAHPVRVWCDLHAEQRGTEFADQLWSRLTHAR
jgi:DNA-binding transcriptional ArsR family regulator